MNQATLNISLLGGVVIRLNETAVTGFASRKAEALLIYLVCNRRPIPRETLATLLWPDNTQSRALANLSVALASLRKQLADYILAERHTIAFNTAAPFQLDVMQLEAAQVSKGGKMNRGVTAQLATAVSHYQGDFLAGFNIRKTPEFEAWTLLEQERLRQVLLAALSTLISFYQQRQQFDLAIRCAHQFLAVDPLQETVHRQLMALYAQAKQRTAALAQYETCAHILAEELGVAPDEETTILYKQLLSGAWQAGKGQSVVAETRDKPLHNLPAATDSFIGREAEWQQVDKWLMEPNGRLLTIIGPGGMGKTRLAMEVAHGSLGKFADGIWFAPLVSVQDENGLVTAIGEAVGLKFSGATPLVDQLATYLAAKEMLLLLDNFEQLLETAAVDLVERLVRETPEIKLLITSRGRLNLQAEKLLDLRGLPLPRTIDDPNLATFAAVKLFVRRANQLRSDFVLHEGNQTAVYQICHFVSGLPLALELAASWIRVLTAAEIAAEIERGLTLLSTTMRDVVIRHRSIEAVFQQSWALLTAREQDLLTKLAVFRGGFTLEAAQQVADASLSSLAGLIDKSLLRRDAATGWNNGRYQWHPLVGQFAAQKLTGDLGEETAVRKRHANYFAAFMEPKAAAIHRLDDDVLDNIRAENSNLRAAWDWAVQNSYAHFFQKSWLSFYSYLFEMEARYEEGIEHFRNAIAALETSAAVADHQQLLSQLWARFGWFHMEINQVDIAGQSLEKSLQLAQTNQFPHEEAYALGRLGMVRAWQGDMAGAQELLTQSVQLCRQLEQAELTLASSLSLLGVIVQYQGDYAASLTLCQESADLARHANDLIKLDAALTNLGSAWFYLESFANARQAFVESLLIVNKLGNRSRQATTFHNLMEVALKQEDFAAARRYGQQAVELFSEVKQQQYLASTYSTIARIELNEGHIAAAKSYQNNALTIAQQLEPLWVHSQILLMSGRLLIHEQAYEEAAQLLAFVLKHETALAEHREQAEELLTSLQTHISPARLAECKAAAASMTLRTMIAQLLSITFEE